jgi:DNA replication protein DnaC
MTPERLELENAKVQADADRYNERPGALNVDHMDANGNLVRGDGIDCEACLNKGSVYVVLTGEDGVARMYFKQCSCMKRRLAVRRIRESGMERALETCKLERFAVENEWQQRMKDAALAYLNDGVREGAWLYIGGQSGSGKTMICTATVGVILRKRAVRYMTWPHEAQKIKAVANAAEQYEALVKPLKEADVLYIDDFWKPTFGRDGREDGVSGADVRLAFDVLNYRYVNRLPTIISSEWFSSELAKIDEAVAGRVIESAGVYRVDIGRDKARNMRMKGNTI